MNHTIEVEVIAKMRSDFGSKFGIPRQSGLADIESVIEFEPDYRNPDALRGIEGYSHLWILWQFSEAADKPWTPTVRPPRLGGNTRMGVFATRSPFRPNHIGLSCVRLIRIEQTPDRGVVLIVSGADLMDGTPIIDIKPYIPYSDSYPEALGGFTDTAKDFLLNVNFPDDLLVMLPENKRSSIIDVLSHDPRPSYQKDSAREYGMLFAGFDIGFQVNENILYVTRVVRKDRE